MFSREKKILGNMMTSNKYLQFNSLNKGGELFIVGQRVLAKGQGKENLLWTFGERKYLVCSTVTTARGQHTALWPCKMRTSMGWGYVVTALRVGEGSWACDAEICSSLSDPEPHPAEHRHSQISEDTPAWLCVVTCGIKHSSFGVVLNSLS